jgi:hypothetical protein
MLARFTCLLGLAFLVAPLSAADKEPAGITVDKTARTVTIDCKVAPRKLERYKEIYPIEVIACYPDPKGRKAHETVVTFNVKPSDVHKALESLGLKPGKPAMGKGMTPMGPEVLLFLDLPAEGGGKAKRVPIEETLVEKATGKPMGKLKWLFTGSVMSYPDPEKDDKVYGADQTGTLITVYSVTNETVLQSALSFEQESSLKIETNTKVLPKIGTPVKLVIQAK